MNHNIDILYEGNIICSINANSPMLSDVVEKVILNEKIDLNKIDLKCEIDKFDTNAFKEILISAGTSIRSKLTNEREKFEQILKTIETDQDVIEYYSKLKEGSK